MCDFEPLQLTFCDKNEFIPKKLLTLAGSNSKVKKAMKMKPKQAEYIIVLAIVICSVICIAKHFTHLQRQNVL